MLHVEEHTIWFIAMFDILLVEDGHEVDIEVLLWMSSAALCRVTHKDVAIEHYLMRIPVYPMLIDLELTSILFCIYGQVLSQKVEEMAVFVISTHRIGIVLDLLFIVDTTFHSDMVFLIGIVLFEILTYSRRDNLRGRYIHGVNQKLTTNTTCIQITEIINQIFNIGTICFLQRVL